MPFPIALVAGIAGAIGVAKFLFGLHGLFASTVLGPSVGPLPIVLMTAVDTFVGGCLLVAGIGLLARRRWARELLSNGSLLVVGYEIGRSIGLAVASPEAQDFYGALWSIAFVVVLIVMLLVARSRHGEAYVRSPG
jgi:hypothetical protein